MMAHRSIYFRLVFLTIACALTCAAALSGCVHRPSTVDVVARYEVRGIDISAHNGAVDFDALKAAGYEFVLLKASEGIGFKDQAFFGNYRKANKAGLKVGAYHFFRFDVPGHMQALNYLHSVRGRQLDFPLVIDLEEWGNPRGIATDVIISRLEMFLEYVGKTGRPVMFYTNKRGYERFIKDRFEQYQLWMCSFTPIPADVDWTFWQYSHSGEVAGVSGDVDLDVFSGDLSVWTEWCRANCGVVQ